MLIVLPPSETKRIGGFNAAVRLSHNDALGEMRSRVAHALVQLSRNPDAAASALKLGVKNRHESALNLDLDGSGVVPAVERYTGVLYDALRYAELNSAAQSWVSAHVAIQSALFGLIGADDRIPAYRLSASTTLPALGMTLKRAWRAAHTEIEWEDFGLVLDLRSKSYAGLAPIPGSIELHVAQLGADGEFRALNHFNKAAKGDFVRRLAASQADVQTLEDLVDWADDASLDLRASADTERLTLVTELGAPLPVTAR